MDKKENRKADGRFAPGTETGKAHRFKAGVEMRPRKDYWGEEWLRMRYVTAWRTVADIAREAGCSESNIWHWLRRHGIEREER
jgi:hypothetical protein